MTRDSKQPSAARDSVAETAATVAARVLPAWLGAVHDRLREVVEGDASEEAIHDLRVATRRAGAAIDGWEPILPTRRVAWFRTRLKRLRRAAGKVRDLDGMLRDLEAQLEAHREDQGRRRTSAGIVRATEVVESKRAKAFAALIRTRDRFPGRKAWQAHVRKLVAGSERSGADMSFDRFAAPRLGIIADRFFKAVVVVHEDTDSLHTLRIRAKRARYATEILAPSSSPSRRRCLASFERFQDLAGRCIDQVTAASKFARWARRAEARADRRMFSRLARAAAKNAKAARRRALAWLTPSRLRLLAREVDRLWTG